MYFEGNAQIYQPNYIVNVKADLFIFNKKILFKENKVFSVNQTMIKRGGCKWMSGGGIRHTTCSLAPGELSDVHLHSQVIYTSRDLLWVCLPPWELIDTVLGLLATQTHPKDDLSSLQIV